MKPGDLVMINVDYAVLMWDHAGFAPHLELGTNPPVVQKDDVLLVLSTIIESIDHRTVAHERLQEVLVVSSRLKKVGYVDIDDVEEIS